MAANTNQTADLKESLINAVRRNNIGQVDKLVKLGVSVNIQTDDGEPIIHIAIRNYHTSQTYSKEGPQLVDYLLKAGADVNVFNKNGETPLTFAAYYGLEPLAQLLIEHGADINKSNNHGEPPLLVANDMKRIPLTAEKRSKVTALLFKNGANPNVYNKNGDTLLIYAIRTLNDAFLEVLAANGADPNTPSILGELPLITAIMMGEQSMVDTLVSIGANPLQKGIINGKTYYPIYIAMEHGDPYIINILISASPTIQEFERLTGMGIIAKFIERMRNEDIAIITSMIQKGLDINYSLSPETGYTGLMLAAQRGGIKTVEFLLANGADVMQPSTTNLRAVMFPTNPAIRALILAKMPRWKGLDRDDVDNKFTTIFDREETATARSSAENMSMCPICLNWVSRVSGCMYMTHNCCKESIPEGSTRFVHFPLYKKYIQNGLIEWCTICGRICGDSEPHHHRHYPQNNVNDPVPSLINVAGNPFGREADCIAFGGGGLDEKLARYRIYLKTAHELESHIDIISEFEAYEKLAEACWNPTDDVLEARTANMTAKKFLNVKNTNFRRAKANVPNMPPAGPAPDIEKPIKLATKIVDATNVEPDFYNFMMDDPDYSKASDDADYNPLLEIPYEGGYTERVTLKTLRILIRDRIDSPNDPTLRFGYCFSDPTCMTKLYPSDIKGFVDDTTYQRYRELFNEKFRGMRGGRRNRTRKGLNRSRRRRRTTRRYH